MNQIRTVRYRGKILNEIHKFFLDIHNYLDSLPDCFPHVDVIGHLSMSPNFEVVYLFVHDGHWNFSAVFAGIFDLVDNIQRRVKSIEFRITDNF